MESQYETFRPGERVKLVDYLREYQETERAWAVKTAEALGADESEFPQNFRNVDVAQLAESVMAGLGLMLREDDTFLDRIDLANLQMNDTGACMLGQSLGWYRGMDILHAEAVNYDKGITIDTACWMHGFDIPDAYFNGNNEEDDVDHAWTYHDLSIAWEFVVLNFDRLEGVTV